MSVTTRGRLTIVADSSTQVFGGRRGGRVAALTLLVLTSLTIMGFAIHQKVVTPPALPAHSSSDYPSQIATEMARCPQIPIMGDGILQRILELRPDNDGYAAGFDPFSGQPVRRLTSLESHAADQDRKSVV